MKFLGTHDGRLGMLMLCLPPLFTLLIAAYSWFTHAQMAREYAAVNHAYAVSNKLDTLLGQIADAAAHAPSAAPLPMPAGDLISAAVNDLVTLTADDVAQKQRLGQLRVLLDAHRQAAQTSNAQAHAALYDQIRSALQAMRDHEAQFIQQRHLRAASVSQTMQRSMALVVLALAATGLLILTLVWRNRKRYITAQQAIQDVESDKERLQNKLAQNYSLLARVGEMAKVGGWEVDITTRRLTWSQEVFRIHELASANPPDIDTAYAYYAPEARPIIQAAVESAIRDGTSWDLELPLITAKGNPVWVRAIGLAVLRDGVPVKLEGAFQDITDRKRAELALERSTRLLNEIVENMPAMVFVKRAADLRFEMFNRAGEALLGYSRHDLLGKNDYDFFPKEQADAFCAEDRKVLASTQVREIQEELITTASGASHFLFTRKVSLRNEYGEPTHLLGISLDITARKQAEAALQDMNEQLIVARDRAEAASTAKGQFLANMSHEIRTPMNAILGMVQLLGQTELTARQHDYVEKTQSAAQSLLGILNDILDFSKIEAGKMSLDIQPFSLDKLLRDLSVILSTSLGKKEVEAILDVDMRLPLDIKGDAMRLQQVLINLTSNAVKFTERGEIVVSLKMAAINERTVTIAFMVRDSGIGIAAEHMTHIFEGFSQGEASTTRRFGGTGLGLAISRQLVALMGGDLQASSTPGEGSCFGFSLSFERVEKGKILHDKYLASSLPGLTREHALRALIVDDNALAREVLHAMVASLGWQADVADSGQQALQLLKKSISVQTPYDVVFMDWKMPDMDGWQTTRQVRDLHAGGNMPIIILVSAHGRELLAEELHNEPNLLDGFLVKPVTASMLFDAVADAKAGLASTSTSKRYRAASTRLAGLRLLVVEDNMMNQQVAGELLSNEGAVVSLANNGRLGVEAVRDAQPQFDAVLMDIQMPDMDGYTATREIRRQHDAHTLPIIAMTANAMESERAACLAAGMDDHIAKPIDLESLVTVLLQHCRGSSEKSQAAQPRIATSPPVILDFEQALQRLGGDHALFARMARSFTQNAENVTADVRRYLQSGEKERAARLLHMLKGSAGTVGAQALLNYLAQAEKQLRQTDAEQDDIVALKALEDLVQQSCDALQDAINRPQLPQTPPETTIQTST